LSGNWQDWLCYLADKAQMAPNILIFIYIFRYETIETYARAFLALIILAIGTVKYNTA
jgi:hypothetical protein